MRRLVQLLLAVVVTVWVGVIASVADARTDATRFDVAGTSFVVDAPDGMRGFRDEAVDVIDENWAHVAQVVGTPAGNTVYVSIEHEMGDWFTRREVPAQPPEWAAGLAIPSYDTILLVPGVPDWESTLVHEMTHIALAVATGYQRVPRWANEGHAIYVAEQWDMERATTMIRAGLTGNYYDFDELTDGFPPAASSADLAYAQSFHLVRYILERHGEDTFKRIFEHMRTEGDRWTVAYVAVTDESLQTTIRAWEDHVKGKYIWSPIAGGTGVGWGVAAVLAVLAWRRKRRHREAGLERLEREEAGVFGRDLDDEIFG